MPETPRTPGALEQERVFAPGPVARGRSFAATWWGRAWLKALQDTALDGDQLAAGRRLARAGSVGAVSVRPGRLTSVVRDKDGTGHRSDVLLHRFTEREWDRFLSVAVERAGHVAALLAHEMPHHLVEDAAAAGVELLPGIGDLEAECDCGAWDHCAHSSALCYQVARLLDEDPFVVLLLRGMPEGPLLDALAARSASRQEGDAEAQGADHGVDAHEAFAAADILPPLPAPDPVPASEVAVPSLHTQAPADPALDVDALSFLMAETAAEACRVLVRYDAGISHELSVGAEELTGHQDALRLLSADPPASVARRLRGALGGADVEAAVRAWRTGGAPALQVLEAEWEPGERDLAGALASLDAAWAPGGRPELVRTGNRWTLPGGHRQLRLGGDGRWWPYAEESGRWVPAGPPDRDPAAALSPEAEEAGGAG